MEEICSGDFAPRRAELQAPEKIRVLNWNINRGLQLQAVADFLASQKADLILLQEVDMGARRTGCQNIAHELARQLQLNYVFGREFEELTQQTSNGRAYHGQATLSRYAQTNARLIRFRRQSDFWRPQWYLPRIEPFQGRLGGRVALVTEIEINKAEALTVYNLHLESRGSDELRLSQLREAINDASKHIPQDAIVLAGDFNFDVLDHKSAATLLERAGLRNAIGSSTATTAKSFLKRAKRIDWALVSGPIRANGGRVHREVDASDHYPMSFSVE